MHNLIYVYPDLKYILNQCLQNVSAFLLRV